MQQGISLQAMSIDCLNTSKHFTLVDCINTLEASSSQVRQAFSRLTQEHQAMADEWFRLMHNRGWYQVPEARPEVRTQVANWINSLQTNMMGTGQQTFTTSPQPSQYGITGPTYGGPQYGYGQGGFGSQIYGQQSAAQASPISGTSSVNQQYLK